VNVSGAEDLNATTGVGIFAPDEKREGGTRENKESTIDTTGSLKNMEWFDHEDPDGFAPP